MLLKLILGIGKTTIAVIQSWNYMKNSTMFVNWLHLLEHLRKRPHWLFDNGSKCYVSSVTDASGKLSICQTYDQSRESLSAALYLNYCMAPERVGRMDHLFEQPLV